MARPGRKRQAGRLAGAHVGGYPDPTVQDVDEEIRDIKREIVESRALTIRTNNLVNALAADVKSIARRQAGYERRFAWNGAVAYVLFAALSFAGLKLAADARISEIEAAQQALERETVRLRRELAEETRRAEARVRAEAKAARFYDLIRQQKRTEVVTGYEAIRRELLSRTEAALFRDTVDRFRLDLSIESYQEGLDLMRTDRFAEASEKFREALRLQDRGAHLPAVRYQLARALARLNRQSEAIVLAQEVVEQEVDRELQDDALWLVAECAEQIGQLDDARNALRALLRRFPRSSLVPDARRRLADLNVRVLRTRQAAATR
ncbi:MAG: tetratricopeptide repeat protein [Myxococcota bacterium]|nr:tetratricopeptide repeat protein [Myxococcota bacterium]MDW8363463.1 tetratricopeptide repeat protein [Myxococcales bacterium]